MKIEYRVSTYISKSLEKALFLFFFVNQIHKLVHFFHILVALFIYTTELLIHLVLGLLLYWVSVGCVLKFKCVDGEKEIRIWYSYSLENLGKSSCEEKFIFLMAGRGF